LLSPAGPGCLVAGWLCAAGTALAEPAGPPVPRFVDDSAGSGIAHSYTGDWEFFVGGGVASFDCDDDGRTDLYMAGGAGPARLYRNVSAVGGALRFAAVADDATDLPNVTGAYPLDVDGDGRMDLVVLRVGENVVLRGRGGCRFERANAAWRFPGGAAWSTAFTARWDRGRDWPTAVIGNYVDRDKPGTPFGTCHDNILLRPAGGTGFAPPQPLRPGQCALSALFSDWNRDGSADLRLSNDRQYNDGGEEQLWRIPATGAPARYGRADGWQRLQIWGMGIASRDLDADGYPEYLLTSMADNKLRVLADGPARPSYADAAYARGVTAHRPYTGGDSRPSTAWHAEFADVNNDGRADLFIAKGNVEAMKEFAQRDPNNLLLGRADGRFVEAGEAAGVVSFARGRGAAVTDLNLDGWPDLVVVNRGAPAQVWRNRGRAGGNWLQLQLRQPGGNRHAVGAWIELEAGGRRQHREVSVGGGHAGGQAGWIHFGLGEAKRAWLRVQWPGGGWGPAVSIGANRFVVVHRERGATRQWLPPGG